MRKLISSILASFPAGGSVESIPLGPLTNCGDLTVHLTEEGPAYGYDTISDRAHPNCSCIAKPRVVLMEG